MSGFKMSLLWVFMWACSVLAVNSNSSLGTQCSVLRHGNDPGNSWMIKEYALSHHYVCLWQLVIKLTLVQISSIETMQSKYSISKKKKDKSRNSNDNVLLGTFKIAWSNIGPWLVPCQLQMSWWINVRVWSRWCWRWPNKKWVVSHIYNLHKMKNN